MKNVIWTNDSMKVWVYECIEYGVCIYLCWEWTVIASSKYLMLFFTSPSLPQVTSIHPLNDSAGVDSGAIFNSLSTYSRDLSCLPVSHRKSEA